MSATQTVMEAPAKSESMKQVILRLHEAYPNMSSSELYDNWESLETRKRPKAGYVYSVIDKADKEKAKPVTEEPMQKPQEPQKPEQPQQPKEPEVETAQPTVTGEPTVEDLTNAEKFMQTEPANLYSAVSSGQITAKTVESLFRIENKAIKTMLGEDMCFDEETIQMLGAFGAPPIQRIFGNLISTNMDLLVFGLMVLYAHTPILLKVAKQQGWFNKLKRQQPQQYQYTPPPPTPQTYDPLQKAKEQYGEIKK